MLRTLLLLLLYNADIWCSIRLASRNNNNNNNISYPAVRASILIVTYYDVRQGCTCRPAKTRAWAARSPTERRVTRLRSSVKRRPVGVREWFNTALKDFLFSSFRFSRPYYSLFFILNRPPAITIICPTIMSPCDWFFFIQFTHVPEE